MKKLVLVAVLMFLSGCKEDYEQVKHYTDTEVKQVLYACVGPHLSSALTPIAYRGIEAATPEQNRDALSQIALHNMCHFRFIDVTHETD